MEGTAFLLNLVGSVALLLWAVRMVRTGMTRAFGASLRRVLAGSTRNAGAAFATGLGVTVLLQSSTATSLIVSSFAQRALITGGVALAIVLGADVGSALVAQIFTLRIEWLGPVLLAGGVFAFVGSKSDRVRVIARIFIGLGLMFLALRLLGQSAAPLRDSAFLMAALNGLAGEPLLAFLIAGVLTWLAHSSLAVVLFVMALAAAGTVTPALALAMVVGANVGGALAPYLDQSTAPPAARRVPLGNLLMRLVGAVAVLAALAPAARWISFVEADPARFVVNAHLAFNVAVAVVFLPLTGAVAALCRRLKPDDKVAEEPGKPRYLDPGILDTPSLALAAAARETLHLGDRVAEMLERSMTVFDKNDAKLLREIEEADNAVDALHEAIKLYLIQVSRTEMQEEESRRYVDVLTFNTNLEHVGDIIDKNLMELASKKIRNRLAFSAEGLAELRSFHGRVMDNLKLAMNVFMARDLAMAKRLLAEKSIVRQAEFQLAEKHYARLREGRPESIETSAIHLDIVRDLKRINGHLTSAAYPILEAAGLLGATRLVEASPNGQPASEPAAPVASASPVKPA
jgi:phosphate:Na+ symporter